MTPLGNIGAVFLFEWRRAVAPSRLAWWFMLVLFPPFIVTLVRLAVATSGEPQLSREPWYVLLFALVPMLVSMLGTFLWTTSAVSSELESRSWVYLAVRPRGTTAVLLGKYLAAVLWVLPAALLGLSLAVWLAQSDFLPRGDDSSPHSAAVESAGDESAPGEFLQIWFAIARLTVLSCPAYAALYLTLGALFPRRAMVTAIAYTLIFELIVSFVPAVINKLTVQYRLRALWLDWAGISLPGDPDLAYFSNSLFGDAAASFHVAVLVGYTIALLVTAMVLVRTREFTLSDETDV